MIAFVAHLAGVPRLNKQNLYAVFYGFVYQELPQLKEGPAIESSPLFFRAWLLICSLPNSSQIFQSDKLIFVLSLSYDTVTDSVIYPCLKALFLARQPFQQFSTSTPSAPCAFRGFSLDICSQLGIMISNFGNLFTAKCISIRSNCNISPTQITAQNVIGWWRLGWLRFKLNIEIVTTIFAFAQSSSLGVLTFQQSKLVVPHSQYKPLPTSSSSQTYCPIFFPKRKDTGIVSDASKSKAADWLAIFFSCFSVARNPSNSMDCQLRRKSKHISNSMIYLQIALPIHLSELATQFDSHIHKH